MHVPVLLKETLQLLSPRSGENFVDATIGGGGHSLAILEKTKPDGKVLGIDWWKEAIERMEKIKKRYPELKERLILVCDNFSNIDDIVKRFNFGPVNGILFDLGLSSDLLEQSGRGFSFRRKEPLDMRYNRKSEILASDILNEKTEKELADIFKTFGQEKFSKRIAKAIVDIRQKSSFQTTDQLVEAVRISLSGRKERGWVNPKILARVFQALRIFTNKELENLEKGLDSSLNILSKGGRIAVISYHSLEDRIVKNKFKEAKNLKILTKKPIQPTEKEIEINPRSRSAKLRAAIKN